MTLEQIDVALAKWQGKLNLASANLLELDDLFTHKRLRGTAGDALVGITTLSFTPQQLLSMMMGAFESAKSTILAVDAVWNRLEPLLADAEREAAALQTLAEGLSEAVPPDLATGRRKIDFLRPRLAGRPGATERPSGSRSDAGAWPAARDDLRD